MVVQEETGRLAGRVVPLRVASAQLRQAELVEVTVETPSPLAVAVALLDRAVLVKQAEPPEPQAQEAAAVQLEEVLLLALLDQELHQVPVA